MTASRIPDDGGRARVRTAANRDHPAVIVCEACEKPIEGAVYFHSKRGEPRCADCTESLLRDRFLEVYEEVDRERYQERYVAPLPPFEEWAGERLDLPRSAPCEGCGREIGWARRWWWGYASNPGVWVCSPECRRERDARRRRIEPKPKVCEVCGETFTPKRSDARTCSDRCRQRLRREASRITGGGARAARGRQATVTEGGA